MVAAAWLLMSAARHRIRREALRLDSAEGSSFKKTLLAIAPTGRVPLLVDDGFAVWDSLAIAEYLAERFPDKGVWPADRLQRARARSLCAEMHSGFAALRDRCPMNIEASLPQVGERAEREWPDVIADVRRIDEMWSGQLAESGGPFLFGAFGAADAFYAPVCARIAPMACRWAPARGPTSSAARVAVDARMVRGRSCRARLPGGRRALPQALATAA